MNPVSTSLSMAVLSALLLCAPVLHGQGMEVLLDGNATFVSHFRAIGVSPTKVLVPDHDEGRVLLIGRPGQAPIPFGRIGDGPEEFRSIGRFGALGSKGFWVEDKMQKRLHRISPAGKSLGERSIPTQITLGAAGPGSIQAHNAGVRAVYPDGMILVEAKMPRGKAFGAEWEGRSTAEDEVAFALTDSAGEVRKIAGWLRGVQRCYSSSKGLFVRTPLCGDPIAEVSPAGARILFIKSDSAAGNGRSDRFEVRIVDRDGTSTGTTSIAYVPLRIPRTVRDSMVEGVAKVFPPDLARAIRAAPVPEFFYPVRAAVVADDGSFALEVWDADFAHTYRLFTADGTERLSFTLPSTEVLVALAGGFQYVLRTDRDGIQSVLRGRR